MASNSSFGIPTWSIEFEDATASGSVFKAIPWNGFHDTKGNIVSLQAQKITSLIVRVDSIVLTTPGSNPNGDGNWTDETGTYTMVLNPLAGDANLDGVVDVNDLSRVLTNFDKTGMNWSQGEFTGSGTVDVNDLSIVLSNFGATSSTGVQAVPETSALVLLGIGAISLLAFAHRKRRRA